MENQIENPTPIENQTNNNTPKIIAIVVIVAIVLSLIVGLVIMLTNKKEEPEPEQKEEQVIENPTKYNEFKAEDIIQLNSYEDYEKHKELIKEHKPNYEINNDDFNNYKYIIVEYITDGCSEYILDRHHIIKDNTLKVYYDLANSCGLCAPVTELDIIKLSKNESYEKAETYYAVVRSDDCDPNVAYKPMIYVYPEKDMDLKIKLVHPDLLTSTYPKYNKEWNIRVSKNGNIYDYNTKRNYYGLYWEAKDYTKPDYNKGFVVKGEDTTKFLEEKLSLLGLNDYEINEFIVYWINKLENNKYNYIYFRTTEEVNKYMSLEFSKNPDTLIRILVDFKPLDEYMEIEEQHLTKVERKGYTIVEWGGVFHK